VYYVPYSIAFADSNTGIAVGSIDAVFNTSDGGSTWTMPFAAPAGLWLHGVCYTKARVAVIVGDAGADFALSGANLSRFRRNTHSYKLPNDISFVDAMNGMVLEEAISDAPEPY